MPSDVLQRIRQTLPQLRPSEARIAMTVLRNPPEAARTGIIKLAEACQVSTTTVVRFCQALGFSGYGDFRIALAQAGSNEESAQREFGVSDADILPTDQTSEAIAKLAFHESRAILDTSNSLDPATVDAVASALVAAPRTLIVGAAASALTGLDLQQKLLRIGLDALCFSDPHLALPAATLLTPGCVAVGISHSGQTLETNEAIRLASGAGATTVAITNFPDSSLAGAAQYQMITVARETQFRSGAMSSRMAQLLVVDALFIRVAQLSFDETQAALASTYDAVQGHRIEYRRRAGL